MVFCAMIGSGTPLMVDEPFSEVSSILIFSVTSRLKWMVGVTSMFTPTSWYWNWVLTSELAVEVDVPEEYEPVAMGIFSPIFMVAFCWSVARMRGFCRILVLESDSIALAVAELMVT